MYIEDKEDSVWQLLLLLRTVVSYVTAPFCSFSDIAVLKLHIEEYLTDRHNLFPDEKLKPKHHFLLHYPYLILNFGPLSKVWTLRFESKHSFFKRCTRSSQNYRNPLQTLAVRHQLLQAYHTSGKRFNEDIICEDAVPLCFEAIPQNMAQIVRLFDKHITQSNAVMGYKCIVRNVHYKKGYFLPIDYQDLLTVGKINLILIQNKSRVVFVLSVYTCTHITDYGVYQIPKQEEQLQCYLVDQLPFALPLPSYKFEGNDVIVLKHTIGT